MGVTPSKVYQLLLFKGRAVGGGLSDTRRRAQRLEQGTHEGEAGVSALRKPECGVAGGARPLGGRDTIKALPSLTIQGAGGRGRTEQRPPRSTEAGAELLRRRSRSRCSAQAGVRSGGRGEAAWWGL